MAGIVLFAFSLALILCLHCININANEEESCVTMQEFNKSGFKVLTERDEEVARDYLNILARNASCSECLKNTPHWIDDAEDPIQLVFRFPVYDEKDMLLIEVVHHRIPNPVVLTAIPMNAGNFWTALTSLVVILPTLALCVVWATISGIIVWTLDHSVNADQFPQSFLHGVKEATWWALVTMTTVGYGDKTPKSVLARAYSAFWMLIGIILLSILTAEITSTLTTKSLKEQPIKKVGVPLGGSEFFGNLLHYQGNYLFEVQEYDNQEGLKKALDEQKVDAIVAHYCDNMEVDKYHVISAIRFPRHSIGIELVYDENWYDEDWYDEDWYEEDWDELRKCLKTYAHKVRQNKTKGNKNPGQKKAKNASKFSCANKFKGNRAGKNIKLTFTLYLLGGSVGVMSLLLLIGVIFSRFYQTQQVNSEDADERNQTQEVNDEIPISDFADRSQEV